MLFYAQMCLLVTLKKKNYWQHLTIQDELEQPFLPVSVLRQLLHLLLLKRSQPRSILRGAIWCVKILCKGFEREHCH